MALTDWISGYLVISVKGSFTERFLNLCTCEGLHLKDIEKQKDELLIKLSKKAFAKVRKPAFRSKCKVTIVKKQGLYFKLKKAKKRKIFVFGAMFFVALIFFLNSFIWAIRVDGNKNITEEEIKFVAKYCGLYQGVVKYKLDEKKFSENALKCEPRLSWIWPEIRGTVCYIHVREKKEALPPVNTKEPCDIIAKRSGIIKDITVKRGWAIVSEGDSVIQGQVLISSEKEGFAPVRADGSVSASYWTEVTGKAFSEKETVTYTGKEKTYYSVVFGSFGMSFRFSGKSPYKYYEMEKEDTNVMLFGEIMLPIKIERTVYKETVKDKIVLPLERAAKDEETRIINEYEKKLPEGVKINAITVKNEKISEKEILVKVIFECTEDIALTYIK